MPRTERILISSGQKLHLLPRPAYSGLLLVEPMPLPAMEHTCSLQLPGTLSADGSLAVGHERTRSPHPTESCRSQRSSVRSVARAAVAGGRCKLHRKAPVEVYTAWRVQGALCPFPRARAHAFGARARPVQPQTLWRLGLCEPPLLTIINDHRAEPPLLTIINDHRAAGTAAVRLG